jgi:hypothetical protein
MGELWEIECERVVASNLKNSKKRGRSSEIEPKTGPQWLRQICFIRFVALSSDSREWRGWPGKNKQGVPHSRASDRLVMRPMDQPDLLHTGL